VQRVPELVEERAHLVEGQQGGLTGRRLGHIEVVRHDDRLVEQRVLRDERVHPRPAALRVARVQVEQVEADGGAVVVLHLEHPHVGVVADEIPALGEGDAVQRVRRPEHAELENALGLEPRPQRGGVDVVLLLAHLLGVESPVGCRHRPAGEGLEVGLLGFRVLRGGGRELFEHRGHGIRAAGRLVFRDVGRVVVEAEQLGALGTEPHDLEQDVAVVELAAA
jgi:hypothetical protein